LRGFTITVSGQNEKKCGSDSNVVLTGQTKSFGCEPNAIGNTLMIKRGKNKVITLCEVQVYGSGIVMYKTISH